MVVEAISASLFRVKLQKSMLVVNHDRMKLCRDRRLPEWITKWLENPDDVKKVVEDKAIRYCLCRKPWQGRFMIQCDGCDEWFHGSCVDITPSDALNIDWSSGVVSGRLYEYSVVYFYRMYLLSTLVK